MYQIKLIMPKATKTISCGSDQTIADAAEESGLDILATGCDRAGASDSCVALLTKGSVYYDQDNISLSESRQQAGFILPCVAKPRSDCTIQTDYYLALSAPDIANSWDLYRHYLNGKGKQRTLKSFGLLDNVRKAVKTNGEFGKPRDRSIQGDFIGQIIDGKTTFRNTYPAASVFSNPANARWALGSVTIGGQFVGKPVEILGRYYLQGTIYYNFQDFFSDPYDTFNIAKGNDWNPNGTPYYIVDDWEEKISVQISKNQYRRLIKK